MCTFQTSQVVCLGVKLHLVIVVSSLSADEISLA